MTSKSSNPSRLSSLSASASPAAKRPLGVMILAAGLGKRMKSSEPKVLHELGGIPLLMHLLDRLQEWCERERYPELSILLVVGHGRERVEARLVGESGASGARYSRLAFEFAIQAEQLGTGHAAQVAMNSPWGERMVKSGAEILVLPGDMPLLSECLIADVLTPMGRTDVIRLLTCDLADPTGYGRVVRRGKSGPVFKIVEERDASQREREIREVANSIYLFRAAFLRGALQRISNKNAQHEYYLTDVIALAARQKKKILVSRWSDSEDLRGVNDQWELALAAKIYNCRLVKHWARQGVKFIDPSATWIEADVRFEGPAVVEPGVYLKGATVIGSGASIGAHSVLLNTRVGAMAQIKGAVHAADAVIGESASVGPSAHLRPGAVIGAQSKIGNFVEVKNARIGTQTSVAHLSYIGDADVGDRVNIGCGFVTCNYDGRVRNGQRKHRTVIESEAFIGSDCQVVAPITIGRGAYVASGSTVTEDVAPEALAIARSRQVNKPGYAKKLKA